MAQPNRFLWSTVVSVGCVMAACSGTTDSAPVQTATGGGAGQGGQAGQAGQPQQGGSAGQTAQGGNAGQPGQGGEPLQGGTAGQPGQGGNSAGAGGAAGAAAFSCGGDQPISAAGLADTGLARCANGTLHRKAIVTCGSLVPRPDKCKASGAGDSGAQCITDSDCPAPFGHCDPVYQYPMTSTCQCLPGCTHDADCGTGKICECTDPVGTCVEAECKSDADCGGHACRYVHAGTCGLGELFRCATPADACESDQDCGGSGHRCSIINGVAKCISLCAG